VKPHHGTTAFLLGVIALALAIGGCATVHSPHRQHLGSENAEVRNCAAFFRVLDTAVARNRVGEASPTQVAGFPYLRADRFTASLSDRAQQNDAAFEAWLSQLAALDRDAREFEIGNLPAAAVAGLGHAGAGALNQRAHDCRARLLEADLAMPGMRDLLVERARVPDDYRGWQRAAGLYPLTRLPFYSGVARWQRETEEGFLRAREGAPPTHAVVRYRPPMQSGYTRAKVATLLARAASDPLGIPRFDDAERERLFASFAPVFEVATAGAYDRIGRLVWNGGAAPAVDSADPVVYRHLAYTRYHEHTLVQLIYLAWFPERPKDHAFDLLGGRLDGLIWRVTLAPDGEAVLYDTIHPCGCFHMFFPTPRAESVPAPSRLIEWAFVPEELPRMREPARLAISAQARTHYLRRVAPDTGAEGVHYAFDDYDVLRGLPLANGGTRSAFRADGLVPGTQRGERFFFWPMGVPSAGAMRQWGTHATAFVGRRHFDDADLVEKRFRIID
ncbi:MAG TPA: hypothetical protein VMP00_08360, partial [Burkholderiales bacterium]|nr:hypothetical protein [Burkholderiales bacterium]